MANDIFRKKNLDRVNSPESLKDYICVTNPSIWLILAAVILLLVGTCIWGVMGKMDTVVKTTAIVESGTGTCTVSGEQVTTIAIDMPVKLSDAEGYVTSISAGTAPDTYVIAFRTEAADGIYAASIVTERIRPISFVMN